jgi:adhesin transport system outer membrane protein
MTRIFVNRCGISIMIAGLMLSACAKSPDLDQFETHFDAASVSRVSGDLAKTAFGRELATAVQTNPQFLAAASGVRAAQARENAAKAGFFPRLTLTATLNGQTAAFAPVLQVLQLVYDGGATASRHISARARVFEQRGARLELANALTMQAVQAVQDLAAAQRIADLAATNEAQHRDLLSQVEARADAGAGGDTDVLTLRARLASASAQLATARTNAAKAAAASLEIFGQAPKTSVTFLPDAPSLPQTNQADMIAKSPRILGYDAQIKAAEADLANARALWFPQARLRGVVRDNAGGALETRSDLDISANAGARGERASAVAIAQADLDGLIAARNVIDREIRRAFDDLAAEGQAGPNRLAAMQTAVDANRDLVEASQAKFAAGRSDLIGLMDAQRDLFDARQALIIAQRDVGLIGYAALALSGDIINVFGITLPREDLRK